MSGLFKHLTVVLVLVSWSISLSGQPYHFEGEVRDKATFSPLSYVSIGFTGSRMGCVTDDQGKFSIDIDTLPVNMIVTHIGYKAQRIWFDQPAGALSILLEPSSTMLKEVEIVGNEKPLPFTRNEKFSVLDYEIDNNLVYILVFRHNLSNSILLCETLAGDTVAKSGVLPFRPVSLFTDCLGFMHILSADSVYQVCFLRDSIGLCYAYGMQKFTETLKKCVASTDDRMFFQEEIMFGLVVNFYYIDRKTNQKKYITSSADNEMLNTLYRNPSDSYFLSTDTIPDGDFDEFVEYAWVRKILYEPNASVMHRVGDTLCLFNTADGTIGNYDLKGDFLGATDLNFDGMNQRYWTREIYVDPAGKALYTSFLKYGTMKIYRIDMVSGTLHLALITSHAFPEKPRVYNNYLYYMYNVPGEGDTKQLYRQRL